MTDRVDRPLAGQLPLFDPRAVARAGDPGTSWEAAESIAPERIRFSQRLVLAVLRELGPSTDEDIYADPAIHYALSPSGARTRRSELVDAGLVRDTGLRSRLKSGRRSIVWEAL